MRNRYFFTIDVLLLIGLPSLALGLRYETFAWSPEIVHAAVVYSVLALVIRVACAYGAGLYRCMWRHASIGELERIVYAAGIAGVVTWFLGAFGLTYFGLAPRRLPYSVLALDALLSLGALSGPRLLTRFAPRRSRSTADRRVIVVGAGAAAQLILRETRLNARLHLQVIGFVDDDSHKQGQLLGGLPVLGTLRDLPDLIGRFGVRELIIAVPHARGSMIRMVMQAASDAGIEARTMPGMEDLISGRVKVSALRKVEIEDLLRREPIITDLDAVRGLTTGKVVLVTGAGGSIGSELCRQLAQLGPASLILLDHSENQVFEIHAELSRGYPGLDLVPMIADIRDAARLQRLMCELRPYAVYHAAAHKHVPMMEANTVEAITNNILGSRNVVEAAIECGTRHLVNISTDKAVRPTSIMGATKRAVEKIVLNAAITEQRHFISVRFGNVLGSRGSVIPTFLRQIKAGGPVTVTHPEMRRYFMTIPEAVQLVLQAGVLGQRGELFVLDMGDPVKVVDLARDLVRLSGLEEGVDIDIAFTGVRPGEKLYEEVFFGGEEVRATNHEKVLRAVGEQYDPHLSVHVDELLARATSHAGDDEELRDLLRVLVPEFAREDARTNPHIPPVLALSILNNGVVASDARVSVS